MKRVVIELVAALCVLVGLADPGAPAGQRQPVEPAHMVNAIVILSRQAELAGDLTRSRAQRRAAAERTLRATATESQRAVMDLLGHRLTEGLVSRVVPLWIVNGVSITATPGVLQELARRNDVRGIQPELEFEAPPTRSEPRPATHRAWPNRMSRWSVRRNYGTWAGVARTWSWRVWTRVWTSATPIWPAVGEAAPTAGTTHTANTRPCLPMSTATARPLWAS